MLTFLLPVLAGTAPAALRRYRIATRPIGSTGVVDRDAQRITAELRAITSMSAYR
jgi:hypothetical protein